MKISTRARYGLRFLVELAKNREKILSVKTISERQHIPKRYLEQIVSRLNGAGIIRSFRGPEGGYMLSIPPEKLTLLKILTSLNDPPIIIECIDNPFLCKYSENCSARKVWRGMKKKIQTYLKDLTLKNVIENG